MIRHDDNTSGRFNLNINLNSDRPDKSSLVAKCRLNPDTKENSPHKDV